MGLFFSSFGRDISIDMGTQNTRVLVSGQDRVLCEPSMVATDQKREGIVAVGLAAESLIRQTPDTLGELWPLREGYIVDYRITHTMFHYFLHEASKSVRRARAFVSIPCGMSDVELRAVTDAVLQAGAREAYLIQSPVAAALGAGLPVFKATGSLVVDIGLGTLDIAVISLGGLVTGRTVRLGKSEWSRLIVEYLNDTHTVTVATATLEAIKEQVGTARRDSQEFEYIFQGRDTTNGLMVRKSISSSELYDVLHKSIVRITTEIRNVMRQTPPELLSDIMENGIVLTGGGALLNGLAEQLQGELTVPVRVAQNPKECVVRGLNQASEHLALMKRFIVASNSRKGNG